jgi:murein DD-endopeptidase MepM/ murein hydrolase activator NlpD
MTAPLALAWEAPEERHVSSWWTTAIEWKVTCFVLVCTVAMLGGFLYRATAQQGVSEAKVKRLAGQLLIQAQVTRDVIGVERAQGKTIDILSKGQLDLSRISVGLLRHEQETSPVPVQIANLTQPRSGTRQLAGRRSTAGWTLAGDTRAGGFVWPVHGPISSGFGPRGGGEFHPGIDIAVPSGTPIHAAAAGRVTTAGYSGGYGNLVVIQHEGPYATAYGHQSRLEVYVGEAVQQGQLIGYVGTTGNSTGPHLHFEVRINGRPTDPARYLK